MKILKKFSTCSICGEKAKGLGFCSKHYQSFKYSGNPIATRKYRNTMEDLLDIVSKIPCNENGCKLWIKSKNIYGYGIFVMSDKSYLVHRILYTYSFPGKYDNIVIRHTGDIRNCCNTDHLQPGSALDNMKDKISRGRQAIGIDSGTAKLNDEKVREIRSNHPALSYSYLAKKYGVTKQAIASVVKRKSWKHI